MSEPQELAGVGARPTVPGADPTTTEERKAIRKAITGSSIGNAVEWYDFGVYGYLAAYMATNFFGSQSGDGGLGLTLALATWALAFLARPLGGFVFGPIGDRIGRQRLMVITVALMTLSTAAIGVLPTIDMVGVWAPLLLLLSRLVQGFAAGGEYGGAAIYMAEVAPDSRRGRLGSFLEFGTISGFIAAAVICTTLVSTVGPDGMSAGWWRLPFLIALPLGLVALWIRTHLKETAIFSEAVKLGEIESAPIRQAFRKTWPQMIVFAVFVMCTNIAYYMVLGYMPVYLSVQLGYGPAEGNWMLIAVMVFMLILLPFFGSLSDRIGRKPQLLVACGGYVVLSVPAFLLLGTNNLVLGFLGLAVIGLLLVLIISIVSAVLPAMFPTQIRYTSFAITYNVALAFFAGPSQAVANDLINSTGNLLVPGIIMAVFSLFGGISVLFMRETSQASLRGNDFPGEPASRGFSGRKFVEINRQKAAAERKHATASLPE